MTMMDIRMPECIKSKANSNVKYWLLVLWVGVIFSALSVIHVSHACRVLTDELSTLERGSNTLQEMWGKYLLEKSAEASLVNIEVIAKDSLKMRAPRQDEFVAIFP